MTATNSLPLTTPPQTPLPGVSHSATSSFSSTVLGKRDIGAASESEKEEAKRETVETVETEKPAKKRRIAPTLVSKDSASFASEQAEKKPEPTSSSEKVEPAPPAEKVEAEKGDQAAAQ